MTLTNNKYGLTLAGLKIKPFEVITSEIESELVSKFGQIDLNPRSVFSMIINIFAEREALIWQLLEQTYSAMYPSTAEGVSLDNVCAINGLSRLRATRSYVLGQITATNYTTIPEGSEVMIENTGATLVLTQEITVNNEACNYIVIEITDVNEPVYRVTINNIQYSYEKEEEFETAYNIANELMESIIEGFEANNIDEFEVEARDNFVSIKAKDVLKTFSCFITEEMRIVSCTNNAYFSATELGNIAIPAGSAKVIKTPVYGWLGVNNVTAGIMGRNIETDIELRNRREASLRLSGSGTLEALRARLLNITGVTFADIIDNRTNEPIGDLPPHSFKVIILGGAEASIGSMIWQAQPLGIESVGLVEQQVQDASGKTQVVKFSRPRKVWAYIDIKITKNDSFAEGSKDAIKAAVLAQTQALGLGESLIQQSLFAAVYSVKGISGAIVEIGKTSVEMTRPDVSTSNIEVGATDIITTDANKITVEVND